MVKHLILLFVLFASSVTAHGQDITDPELQQIAALIFQNECASNDACLTSWNEGEGFASLGIGHFIWYPIGTIPTFQESFPALIAFMQHQGATLPKWLAANPDQHNPWPDREDFIAAYGTQKMTILRTFLMRNKPLQATFMQQRLQATLPKLLAGLDGKSRQHVRQQFAYVADSPMGMYVLMDYVNFKGEGSNLKERYHGKGWGMLQVLQHMAAKQSGTAAITAFAHAADIVLTRRVELSPPARNEQRWLPGWRKRLTTYVRESKKGLAVRHAD